MRRAKPPLWYREVEQPDGSVDVEPIYDTRLGVEAFRDRWQLVTEVGALRVSTVFLGIDHGFDGYPVLYETLVFGGLDEYGERYTTRLEAVAGHARAVALVEGHLRAVEALRGLPAPAEAAEE